MKEYKHETYRNDRGNYMKRISVNPIYSMVVQPAFIIGTNNENGTDNFLSLTISMTNLNNIEIKFSSNSQCGCFGN